jgi:hypothetical protein
MKGIITEKMFGPWGRVEALSAFTFRETVSEKTMEFSHYTGCDCRRCGGVIHLIAGPLAAEAIRRYGVHALTGYTHVCLNCKAGEAGAYCEIDSDILLGYFYQWAR